MQSACQMTKDMNLIMCVSNWCVVSPLPFAHTIKVVIMIRLICISSWKGMLSIQIANVAACVKQTEKIIGQRDVYFALGETS